MALVGLWEGFKWPDDTVTRTLKIVTMNANSMMAEIRDPRRERGTQPVTRMWG